MFSTFWGTVPILFYNIIWQTTHKSRKRKSYKTKHLEVFIQDVCLEENREKRDSSLDANRNAKDTLKTE